VVGVVGVLALGRLISALLFGVAATDPVNFVGSARYWLSRTDGQLPTRTLSAAGRSRGRATAVTLPSDATQSEEAKWDRASRSLHWLSAREQPCDR